MKNKVLFVNHTIKRCGVYEFGMEIADQLSASTRLQFVLAACDSPPELLDQVESHDPVAIIFNYHPGTMAWAPEAVIACFDIPCIGLIHDVTSDMADHWAAPTFDRYLTHDPDLVTRNPLFSTAPRPIPAYRSAAVPPSHGPVRIGSFGFAADDKGFDQLVEAAQQAFDECVVRLHLPGSDIGDVEGTKARALVDKCQALLYKPGVRIEASHDYLSRNGLIDFLASNHLNALFYHPDRGLGGISSAADMALASGRPVALRRGKMFRNLNGAQPSIFVDDRSLPDILASGTEPLRPFLDRWTPAALISAYETAVARALAEPSTVRNRRRTIEAMLRELMHQHKEREQDLDTRLTAMHAATLSLGQRVSELSAHFHRHQLQVATLTQELSEAREQLHAAHAAERQGQAV